MSERDHRAGEARARDRGVALLLVLWVLVLMSVLAAGFLSQTRLEARLARNGALNAQARHLADAGVELAVFWLSERVRGRAHLETLRDDGARVACGWGGGRLVIAIQDEGGKINLNASPEPLLARLFQAAGAPVERASDLAAAVADYRDGDSLVRVGGAEADLYEAAGLPPPKNGPFDAPEELADVYGVDRALYERLRPSITIHSGRGGVDPGTAVPLARRAASSALLGEDSAESGDAAGIAPIYSAFSDKTVYEIIVQAETPQGGVFGRKAVVRLLPGAASPYTTLSWRGVAGAGSGGSFVADAELAPCVSPS